MPSVNSKSFTQLVSDFATAVQSRSSALADFTIGSILRAVSEATASVTVWIESLILLLLQTTRAATSSGADLDSWVADYGLTRLAAVAATGMVTFSRFTPTNQATIAPGVLVQSSDGSLQFAVTVDTTNAAWSVSLGAYVIAAGASSITVPVQCTTTGPSGNVIVGAISLLASAIPYVDTVTNALAFSTGIAAETDTALRARFVSYIANLSKATKAAIGYAVTSVQAGVTYVLVDNADYSGASDPGYFYVVVNDGTGAPSSAFLAKVFSAIDAVRAAGIRFGVYAPVGVTATIALTVGIAAGYDPTATRSTVSTALTSYIAALNIGATLSYTRLVQIAYDASAGVANVTGLTLNGGTSDLTATQQQLIVLGTLTVS